MEKQPARHRMTAVIGLKNDYLKLTESYSDSEIFNADETGLFYKLTPDRNFNQLTAFNKYTCQIKTLSMHLTRYLLIV